VLSKKDWNILLNHGASAVAWCVKEEKIKLESAKNKVMLNANQDTFSIYCEREFNSFKAEDNPVLFRMIQLLRQKALDKEALAEDL
jgi:hypothetical protein